MTDNSELEVQKREKEMRDIICRMKKRVNIKLVKLEITKTKYKTGIPEETNIAVCRR